MVSEEDQTKCAKLFQPAAYPTKEHPYWLPQAPVLSYVSLVWVRREPAATIAVFDHQRVAIQSAQPST